MLLGILGGTFSNSSPSTAPAERGGYTVVEADFHAHSHAGDGLLSPFGVVLFAQRKGLHAIAVTDHNQIYGARAARWFSGLIGGPTVIVGEEITAPDYHLIGLGLTNRVAWNQSLAETLTEIHRQGGVAIAAHPRQKHEPVFAPAIRDLDGSEVLHASAHSNVRRAAEMRNFYERAKASNPGLIAVGSSDYHWFNSLGLFRTYVFVRNNAPDEILEALHNGRTVVNDLEGNIYGDSELIRLLQEQPINHGSVGYSYAASSTIDAFTRTCGWLGLAGLLLFGPGNKKEKNLWSRPDQVYNAPQK